MTKDDKKIIEFIENLLKPLVIEVYEHLGPFWYDGTSESYHTKALAYELNDSEINFDREVAITQYYKGSVITDSPKEADFIIYKDQKKVKLPSGILIEAKYNPGKEQLTFSEVRLQTFRNIVSARSSNNKNINNIYYGVCINWGNNAKNHKKGGTPFETDDFIGLVSPTIELWKLKNNTNNNFIKIWKYQDPKFEETD